MSNCTLRLRCGSLGVLQGLFGLVCTLLLLVWLWVLNDKGLFKGLLL